MKLERDELSGSESEAKSKSVAWMPAAHATDTH